MNFPRLPVHSIVQVDSVPMTLPERQLALFQRYVPE